MTLRIFEKRDDDGAVIALHGWFSAAEVSEVERVAAEQGRPLRIDLECLAGVDSDGLRVLRRLAASGARLTCVSPYFELLLGHAERDDVQR
jgi:hypothetical protein